MIIKEQFADRINSREETPQSCIQSWAPKELTFQVVFKITLIMKSISLLVLDKVWEFSSDASSFYM